MEANLVPIRYRETATRDRIGMMRKSYHNVWKNLTDEMQDACREIEVGFKCVAGHMGYPDSDLLRTRGTGSGGHQEFSLRMADKVKKWRNEGDIKHTGAVIDFVVHGVSFKQMGEVRQRTRQTISTYFYQGLNEYCEMHFS